MRNRATGAEVGAPIIDGAVDPVRLPGATGDTVGLDGGGQQRRGVRLPRRDQAQGPARRGAQQSRDAVNRCTKSTSGQHRVQRAGDRGDRRCKPRSPSRSANSQFQDDELSEGDLVAVFVPDDSLVPGSTYTILVTRGVRDRSGDALRRSIARSLRWHRPRASASSSSPCRPAPTTPVRCRSRVTCTAGDAARRDSSATVGWGIGTGRSMANLGSLAVALEAGQQTTCAITQTSRLLCWGSPYSHLPDQPDRPDSLYPAPAPVLGDRELLLPAVGGGRMCGADRDNSLWCIGVRLSMAGGSIHMDTFPDPHVWLSDPNMAQVSLGLYHDCHVDRSGAAWCRGSNVYGQKSHRKSGDRTRNSRRLPWLEDSLQARDNRVLSHLRPRRHDGPLLGIQCGGTARARERGLVGSPGAGRRGVAVHGSMPDGPHLRGRRRRHRVLLGRQPVRQLATVPGRSAARRSRSPLRCGSGPSAPVSITPVP